MLKFNSKTGYQFDRGDVKGFSFNTKEQFSPLSAAFFECRGKHQKMKPTNSDRLYLALKGAGKFISNNKTVSVRTNEVIIVPKNTIFSYEGKMTCFLIHIPAFDRRKEISYNE